MPRTTTRQKVGLILFGMFLCFILLEVGMRASGYFLSLAREKRNKIAFLRKSDYTILCLGESTTEGRWPPFLDMYLNDKNIGITFKVIDEGKRGINSAFILARLEENVNKYNPDMVITMMGINDGDDTVLYKGTLQNKVILFMQDFRVYKLAKLLWEHIVYKLSHDTVAYAASGAEDSTTNEKLSTPPEEKEFDAKQRYDYYQKLIKNQVEKDKQEKVDSQSFIKLGQLYEQKGEYEKAEGMYKKSLRLNPKGVYAYFDLGSVYIKLKKFDQAEDMLQKGIELDPNDSEGYIRLGKCFQEQDRFDDAVETFEKGIEVDPNNTYPYVVLGACYLEQQKFVEAISILKQAKDIDPNDERVYLKLGWAYIGQENYEEAKNIFEEIAPRIEKDPNEKDKIYYIYGDLGWIYAKQGNYKEAEEILKKAIDLKPDNHKGYQRLGYCYKEQGKFSEAEKMYQKAIELAPDNAQNYVDLALCYAGLERHIDQKNMLLKALEIDPSGDYIYSELGWYYESTGQFEQAEEAYKKALVINRNNQSAMDRLVLFYISQQRYIDVENLLKKYGISPQESESSYEYVSEPKEVLEKEEPRPDVEEDTSSETKSVDERTYLERAVMYLDQGEDGLADEYFQKARDVSIMYYNPATYHNYNALKKIVQSRGIQLVCVQYPLHSVEPLEKLLQPHKNVIFVSNEKVFRNAVKNASYEEYFTDNFAGGFGHCTMRGDKLLAENIGQVILQKVFDE